MAFEKEALYMGLANAAYGDKPMPDGWKIVHQEKDSKTGFQAIACKDPDSNKIIIAYTGSNDTNDWLGPNPAFIGLKSWNKQFTQALDFAEKISAAYPDAEIETTGHSLGGGHAQIVSQMYGWKGMTFDAPGAENLIDNKPFREWAKAHNLPEAGKGISPSFINYTVNGSLVSGWSGDHVGSTWPMPGKSEMTAQQFAKRNLPLYDPVIRHDRDRIQRTFESHAEQTPVQKTVTEKANTASKEVDQSMEKMKPVQESTTVAQEGISAEQREAIKKEEVEKVLNTARNELGYQEKASRQGLDSPSANVGGGNYTKYARDLGIKNGEAWCDTFVDWSFSQNYGKESAGKMLGQRIAAGTEESKGFYEKAGAWHKKDGYTPEAGDQIFFLNPRDGKIPSGRSVNHTGIVEKVENGRVYVIEGNTGNNKVERKDYPLDHPRIVGYGKPDWDLAIANRMGNPANAATKGQTSATAADREAVRQWQTGLNQLGYKGLDGKELAVDGIIGKHTDSAIRAFQKDHGLDVDGIVGAKTSAALEEAIANQHVKQQLKQPQEAKTQEKESINTEKELEKQPAKSQKSSDRAVGEEEKPKRAELEDDQEFEVPQAVDANKIAAEQQQAQQQVQNAPGPVLDLSIVVQLPVAILKGLESLVSKLGELIPTININLSLYCANNCMKSGMNPGDVDQVSLQQTETGKNLVCMTSADGQLATADIDKGMNTPVEQSIEAINQQQQSQQQAAEQQQKAMAVA